MFKASHAEAGMRAERSIVEDARDFNNAIISAEIYQSASAPSRLTQWIAWKSIKEAKAAFAASDKFLHTVQLMEWVTEKVPFDYFDIRPE